MRPPAADPGPEEDACGARGGRGRARRCQGPAPRVLIVVTDNHPPTCHVLLRLLRFLAPRPQVLTAPCKDQALLAIYCEAAWTRRS